MKAQKANNEKNLQAKGIDQVENISDNIFILDIIMLCRLWYQFFSMVVYILCVKIPKGHDFSSLRLSVASIQKQVLGNT